MLVLLFPLLLKLLLTILKTKAPGLDLTKLINYTQQGAIQNYMKNLYQIVNLVTVLTLMGLVSDEIKNKTFILPYLNNANISEIIFAKFIVYSIVIFSFTLIGLLINYYYSKVLFSDGIVDLLKLFKSSLLYGLYFIFNLSLVIFMSSIFKKTIIAGISSLLIIYLMPIFNVIGTINKYLPYFLINQANI